MKRFNIDDAAAGRPRTVPNGIATLHVDDHPAFLPLALCYRAATLCHRQPLLPGWGLWIIMSRLYGLSDRRRIDSYRGFWRAVHRRGIDNPQSDYLRSSEAHREWHGLLYSVGLQPHIAIMCVMHSVSAEIAARATILVS